MLIKYLAVFFLGFITSSLFFYSYIGLDLEFPISDENANGIRIVPEDEDSINVGDIITFEKNDLLIVHRVIEIGIDSEGKYFITKGDNNLVADVKIRFEDIRYLNIGVIW